MGKVIPLFRRHTKEEIEPANDDTPAELSIESLSQALAQAQAHNDLLLQVTKRTLRELTVRVHDLENEVTNLRSTIRRGRL